MAESLFTHRQLDVMRYRKNGMTQQQIADIFHTSKSNISGIERSAKANIRRAKLTMDLFYTLNARFLCILDAGSDLFDTSPFIIEEAKKTGMDLNIDPIDLINRLRDEFPKRIHGRFIKQDIEVFLEESGGLVFG